MAYFRFRRTSDNLIKRYHTKGLIIVNGSYSFILPVWNKLGQRISIPTIQAFNWVLEYVPTQTDERLAYEKYVYFYLNKPTLQSKVEAVKAIYDDLGVAYNCTAEEQEEALVLKYPDPEVALTVSKNLADTSEDAAKIMVSAYRNFMKEGRKDYDPNPVGVWSFYQEFPQLVKWIPGTYTEADIPPRLDPIIVTTEAKFQELLEDMD